MKKIIISLLAFIFLYIVIYMSLDKIELENSNSDFVNGLLNSSNYFFYPSKIERNLLSSFINKLNGIELSRPITIVEKTFYQNSNYNIEFGYIQNDVIDKPQVYIYTTHYNEKYIDDKTVLEAAYLLQSKLNELGVMTIVEERSVSDYLVNNSLEYKDSYKATRQFLKDTLENYPDLDLIIDLHRDAISKETSTISIDGVDYAKVMFVMNENYPNMEIANKLNNILVSKLNISRGIYHKKVDNFNQDLNTNVVLIEMGANYNDFIEVSNSIKVLADSIKELINEKS